MNTITVHASCVAFGNNAILLRGTSGSGKSDLLLQLIDGHGYGFGTRLLRAKLVADDQVVLTRLNNQLVTTAPDILKGKLEVRGRGIVLAPYKSKANLAGVIELMPRAEIERLPELTNLQTEFLGLTLPLTFIDPAAPSAAARIRFFLNELLST